MWGGRTPHVTPIPPPICVLSPPRVQQGRIRGQTRQQAPPLLPRPVSGAGGRCGEMWGRLEGAVGLSWGSGAPRGLWGWMGGGAMGVPFHCYGAVGVWGGSMGLGWGSGEGWGEMWGRKGVWGWFYGAGGLAAEGRDGAGQAVGRYGARGGGGGTAVGQPHISSTLLSPLLPHRKSAPKKPKADGQ